MIKEMSDPEFIEFLHSESFEDLIKKPMGINCLVSGIRPDNRREGFNKPYATSMGGKTEYGGDIVLVGPYNQFQKPLRFMVGAHFDVKGDYFESFLRKMSYDKVMDYHKAHETNVFQFRLDNQIGTASPGIEISTEGNIESVATNIERRYDQAKRWLKLIDSPEFEALKTQLASEMNSELDEILIQQS